MFESNLPQALKNIEKYNTGVECTGIYSKSDRSWKVDYQIKLWSDGLYVKQIGGKNGSSENSILLQWETQSELNNMGFIILKSTEEDNLYEQIASYQTDDDLKGLGNSPFGKKYQYSDLNVEKNVTYWYKLVDVDFDGRKTHHGPVQGKIVYVSDHLIMMELAEVPQKFMLHDNFPNPFNMTTSIRFDIPDIDAGNNIITIS